MIPTRMVAAKFPGRLAALSLVLTRAVAWGGVTAAAGIHWLLLPFVLTRRGLDSGRVLRFDESFANRVSHEADLSADARALHDPSPERFDSFLAASDVMRDGFARLVVRDQRDNQEFLIREITVSSGHRTMEQFLDCRAGRRSSAEGHLDGLEKRLDRIRFVNESAWLSSGSGAEDLEIGRRGVNENVGSRIVFADASDHRGPGWSSGQVQFGDDEIRMVRAKLPNSALRSFRGQHG